MTQAGPPDHQRVQQPPCWGVELATSQAAPRASGAAFLQGSLSRVAKLAAAVLLTSLLAGASHAVAQDGRPRNQIHYPLADEQAGLLEAARKAAQGGRLEQAVELYRSVLDGDRKEEKGYHLGTLAEAKGDQPRRFVGITEAAIAGLRALPPEGQALFRARYDYRAESALEQALRAPEPVQALARAYELYPISSHATRLLESMGDLALERGDLARALRAYRKLLTHHGAEVAAPSRLRRKMLVCAVGLGRPEQTRQLVLELRRDDPEAAIHLSGAPVAVEELIARALRREALQAGNTDGVAPSVHVPRGDSANRAFYESSVRVGPARFGAKAYSEAGAFGPRVGGRIVPGSLQQVGATARSLPLVHQGEVFAFSADGFAALDLMTGEQRRRIVRPRSRPLFQDGNSKVQFGGVIDRGTLVAPLVEEILDDEMYRRIPIKVQIPVRKLIGFDLRSWGWEWDHAQLLDGTVMERWSFPSRPAAEEGVICAPSFSIEGFVNCYVSAFSSRTGEPLWSTWLSSGQVEQTMFGEHATEPLCVPVALHEGVVYASTSFGSVAALDASTGRPLWVTEYDQIEVKAPRGYYADPRDIQWENNAPIVEAGVVVVAPMDSDYFYGYEAATGRRLWKEHRRRGAFGAESDMRYLLAAGEGKVVLGGGHDVLCRELQSGKLLWREGLGGRVVAGRGLIARDAVLVPVDNNKLLVLDLESGRRTGAYDLATTGNLLLAGGSLVVVGDNALAVHKANGRANERPRPTRNRPSPNRGDAPERGDTPARGERGLSQVSAERSFMSRTQLGIRGVGVALVAVASPALLAAGPALGQDEHREVYRRSVEVTGEAEAAIERGLTFLAARQQPNGAYVDGIGRKVNTTYLSQPGSHVGVTALVGMAFLSNGSTPGRGPYGRQVQGCVDFVLASVNPQGFVTNDGSRMYSHAFATLFLAEVYGMAPSLEVRNGLRRAVDLIVASQNEQGGWRYLPGAKDSDVSITVCQVQALRAARNGGIEVPVETIDAAIQYVKRSYIRQGRNLQNAPGGFWYQVYENFPFRPSRTSFSLTAAGVTALYGAGVYDGPEISGGLRYLFSHRNRPPAHDMETTFDYFYGHYYAVQAFFQAGDGGQVPYWSQWYPYVRDQIVRGQKSEGYWQDLVGQNYATAMACIILQIPYRYLPIFER